MLGPAVDLVHVQAKGSQAGPRRGLGEPATETAAAARLTLNGVTAYAYQALLARIGQTAGAATRISPGQR